MRKKFDISLTSTEAKMLCTALDTARDHASESERARELIDKLISKIAEKGGLSADVRWTDWSEF